MWTAPEITRPDGPYLVDEPEMLTGWLDWHRATLLHKCAGLTAGQLTERAVPPSSLSMLGLIRHLTDVERAWFRRRFRAEPVPRLYWRADQPDADFEQLDPAHAEADYARLVTEWDLCRQAVAGASLDDTFTGKYGRVLSLRWVYVHLIEEYARHNGHADLLRQRIDGVTGA